MQKGRDFLANGDISAARVAFRRLADAGVADAALALANTYDPEYLAAHNFIGMRGDSATARALYQRAKELGSPEADRILARMGN
jgi:TPR repeat protein